MIATIFVLQKISLASSFPENFLDKHLLDWRLKTKQHQAKVNIRSTASYRLRQKPTSNKGADILAIAIDSTVLDVMLLLWSFQAFV